MLNFVFLFFFFCYRLLNNSLFCCNNFLSHEGKKKKNSKMSCHEASEFLLGSSVARSTRPEELRGHPSRALRNSLFWISGMKSVSHQHNAAKVKAQLFCCSGERFQEQESRRVLSSPASSRVAKPRTALQLTPLPGVCTLSPSWMNYGPQKYSWTCF